MSGWGVMTVSPPKGLTADAHKWATEKINEQLVDMYPETSGGYADRTVQLPRGAASYTEGQYGGTDLAAETLDKIPEAGWAVITDANDTSDSGTAEVYKRVDGDTLEFDTFVGHGGARGKDVVGMVRDKYGLDCYVSHEA